MNELTLNNMLSMTSREIAELTGKRHNHVLRDIRIMLTQVYDLQDNPDLDHVTIAGIAVEIDPQTKRTASISLDKDHTLTLLTGYDAKSRFKVMVRWQELEAATTLVLSPAELILAQAQQLVAIERSQRQLEQRQARTEQRLDQIETAADHFTVIGWHRYTKQSGSLSLPDAARMGKQASKYCIDNGVSMGQVPDPRFGTVHTYPKWVLDDLFAQAA